jgi:hypothetical protein
MPAFALSYEDQHGAIEIRGELVSHWEGRAWQLVTTINGREGSPEIYSIPPMRAAVGIIERVRRHDGHGLPALPREAVKRRRH